MIHIKWMYANPYLSTESGTCVGMCVPSFPRSHPLSLALTPIIRCSRVPTPTAKSAVAALVMHDEGRKVLLDTRSAFTKITFRRRRRERKRNRNMAVDYNTYYVHPKRLEELKRCIKDGRGRPQPPPHRDRPRPTQRSQSYVGERKVNRD